VVVVAAGARKRVVVERALAGAGPDLPIAQLCAAAGPRLAAILLD
jgi:hypothetical protein